MGDRLRAGKPSRYVTVTEVDSPLYTLRGVVKRVSAFGLSNDNKWRWWIQFTGCLYRRACGSSRLAWSEGRRPPGAVSVFIAWTEWTLAVALLVLRWQHYKISSWLLLLLLLLLLYLSVTQKERCSSQNVIQSLPSSRPEADFVWGRLDIGRLARPPPSHCALNYCSEAVTWHVY